MYKRDPFLEQIAKVEKVGGIETTWEYAGNSKLRPATDLSFKIFKPNVFLNAIPLFLFIGMILFAIIRAAGSSKPLTNFDLAGMMVGGPLMILLGVQLFKQVFDDEGRKFVIRMDHTGISIDETQYNWEDVYEAAIMPTGKIKFLVIAMRNQSTYEKFDLSDFHSLNPLGFAMTLSKYIEYFKPPRPVPAVRLWSNPE